MKWKYSIVTPELHEYFCNPDEEPSAVLALPGDGLNNTPVLCVGTVVIRHEEREPSRGRIMLFAIASPTQAHRGGPARSLHVLTSENVRGCVYAIVRLSADSLVAAVNTSVCAISSHSRDCAKDWRFRSCSSGFARTRANMR